MDKTTLLLWQVLIWEKGEFTFYEARPLGSKIKPGYTIDIVEASTAARAVAHVAGRRREAVKQI